jgi:S1-C subfamily serine protease
VKVFFKFFLGVLITATTLFFYTQESFLFPDNYIQTNEHKENMPEAIVSEQIKNIETSESGKNSPKQDLDKSLDKVFQEENTTNTVIAIPVPLPNQPDFEKINRETRNALVNILCIPKNNSLTPISGSGIIIDPRGIILTNAHIAQYFLLTDFVDCFIRTGNPAQTKYKAKIMYISAEWIKENAVNITETDPKGTGENDYGFLFITSPVSDTSASPENFPFVPLNLYSDPQEKDAVLVAGYPAGFLGSFVIFNGLYSASSIITVKEIFTFNTDTIDLFSIGGSIVSQKGSSGGAVVDRDGNVVGIVVTTTEEDKTSERDLRAITILHINRSLYKEIGQNLPTFLKPEPSNYVEIFYSINFSIFSEILKNQLTR